MAERNTTKRGGKTTNVRERIIDAAIEILAESGVRRLSQVAVSRKAGVRQSHLTYYFPAREDLLKAVTTRGVDEISAGLRGVVGRDGPPGGQAWLERLVRAIADLEHMRLFVGMIVEADSDETVREILAGGTRRMEAVLGEVLGGDDAEERARVVLATAWGVGLYGFLMRPASDADPVPGYLSWLTRGGEVGVVKGGKEGRP
jgi:AcrR family transcriptional regulator